jgi:AcrR family transcriptional regulator
MSRYLRPADESKRVAKSQRQRGGAKAGGAVSRARKPGARKPGAKKMNAQKAGARQPTRGNRTWERRAHARPDEILDAALDEFIAQGFDAARMEDIAKRAGLSKGAVYLYFTGKEALLRGLIEREVKPVFERAAMLARAGAADPRGALRAIAAMMCAVMAQARLAAIPFLVVSLSNRFPDIAESYRRDVIEPARAALEGLIAKGIAKRQFRKVDPKIVSRAFIGPMMFEVIWTHALKGPTDLGDTRWIEAQFDVLLHGVERKEAS